MLVDGIIITFPNKLFKKHQVILKMSINFKQKSKSIIRLKAKNEAKVDLES